LIPPERSRRPDREPSLNRRRRNRNQPFAPGGNVSAPTLKQNTRAPAVRAAPTQAA